MATAIANAESREALARLADEQAALRRVATLVAEGRDAPAVFDAVCEETGLLVGATSVNLSHYTPDGTNVTIAGWSLRNTHVPAGTTFPLTPDTIGGEIVRTREPVRIDSWEGATRELATLVRELGVRSSLGAPVMIEGQLWGALVAATDGEEPLRAGTESRLGRFTELIATAVSNAEARSELIASRARIVAAGDEARRRIERNLHDGTQQRLIAIGLDLQRIQASVPSDQRETHAGLEHVTGELESVLEEVRELSRGLHPPLLSRRGLGPSLRALARRSPIPVKVEIDLFERPPEPVETAVYYVVSEALANAIRYSNASTISVSIGSRSPGAPTDAPLAGGRDNLNLYATVADDGDGGAEPTLGSGLTGLADRINALGGRFALQSPPRRGTTIWITLPLTTP
jgi:signal transduction histidine kinase